MNEQVVLTVNPGDGRETTDLEVPLNISANEFIRALHEIFRFDEDVDPENVFIRCDNPVVLLHGDGTLGSFGLRNGTIINL